jgi:hypothetical protein
MVKVPIGHNEIKEVDLATSGLPADAEILALELQPEGGGNAAVMHGRHALPDRIRGPRFVLFAQPLISLTRGGGSVEVRVTWFVRQRDDTTIRHLVDAARHFKDGRYDDVVVPAEIAVEAAISPVVARALDGFAGRENVERFLSDAATFSHQMNVLVPMIAFMTTGPTLPPDVRGVLNRLRRLRNEVAHDGACATQSRDTAAEHLTGAVFAMRYAELLLAAVDDARRMGRLPHSAAGGP